MRTSWSIIRIPITGALLIIVGGMVLYLAGFRINESPSEPVGIWRVNADLSPAIGDYIYFCPPVHRSRYPFLFKGDCPGGTMPFLKKLVAAQGAWIHETSEGVWINNRLLPESQPISESLGDEPVSLPHWHGSMRLGVGQYWTYGSGDPVQSFDSRYWGPLDSSAILGVAKPVWVMPRSGNHKYQLTHTNDKKETYHHES